jgi:hypothetical protein
MLPLGDFWDGVCLAHPETPFEPEETQLQQCNLGYARGTCPQFPPGSDPDAVRFAIFRDDGHSLQIYYVRERHHHPYDHGSLVYDVPRRSFEPAVDAGAFREQASAYAASFLRRKELRK